jgi:hypothetical protein
VAFSIARQSGMQHCMACREVEDLCRNLIDNIITNSKLADSPKSSEYLIENCITSVTKLFLSNDMLC